MAENRRGACFRSLHEEPDGTPGERDDAEPRRAAPAALACLSAAFFGAQLHWLHFRGVRVE